MHSNTSDVEQLALIEDERRRQSIMIIGEGVVLAISVLLGICLLYTSPSPRDATLSRMPSSA